MFLPSFGIVQGMVPIVGFNFGARNIKRMKDTILYATKIILIYFFLHSKNSKMYFFEWSDHFFEFQNNEFLNLLYLDISTDIFCYTIFFS